MSHPTPPTQFTGKTWTFVVVAIIFGGLGLFSLVMGPLFLVEIIKDARGRPVPQAGVALIIMSVPFGLLFILAAFNIVVRRRPILRICRSGVVINMIGSSSLDGVPLVPSLLRVAWLILSFQGFRQQLLFAPWNALQGAEISGLPMARKLTIVGEMFRSPGGGFQPVATQVMFDESAFVVSAQQIARAINGYSDHTELRGSLVSWLG